MSKAREWPNNCQVARDEAAELVADVIRQLEPVIDCRPLTHEEVYRREVQAHKDATKALRWLESVGARTRPQPQ